MSEDKDSEKKRVKSNRAKGDVTLDEVAEVAGVSAITVSRAINQPFKVAARTLTKVKQAITLTGYVPNMLAGGLASKSSKLIAAIVPSIANLVYAETVRMFTNQLDKAGYQVILGDSGYPEVMEEKLVETILSRKPDGILLTGVDHSINCRRMLSAAKIPIVETWDLTDTPLDAVVGFNHRGIGREVGEFIVKQGFKTVGFVTADDSRASLRQQVTENKIRQSGITDIYTAMVPAPTSMELGRIGTKQLLDRGLTKGVIFCSSDTLAQGVIAELLSREISIPKDIAVIGFGDQVFAAFTHPPLTTIRVDRERIGQEAAKILLAKLNNQIIKNNSVDIGFSIIKRETT